MLIWERSGPAYYAAIEGTDGKPFLYLVVEELPDGKWDWMVWRHGCAPTVDTFGVATTVHEAMRLAEIAAR